MRSWLGDKMWQEALGSTGANFVKEHDHQNRKIKDLEQSITDAKRAGDSEKLALAEEFLRKSIKVCLLNQLASVWHFIVHCRSS